MPASTGRLRPRAGPFAGINPARGDPAFLHRIERSGTGVCNRAKPFNGKETPSFRFSLPGMSLAWISTAHFTGLVDASSGLFESFLGSEVLSGKPGGVLPGPPDQRAPHRHYWPFYKASLDRKFCPGDRVEYYRVRLISGPTMTYPFISWLPWIGKFQPGNRRKTGLPDQRVQKTFEGGQ